MADPAETEARGERLQKVLARAGVASRRKSEDVIRDGRVTVNGVVVDTVGTLVDPTGDRIAVDGHPVAVGGALAYFVLNKPTGFITTMSDTHGRATVTDFLPDEPPGLFAVGRLDRDTDGLLLVTNDGELGHRLMHPRYHVAKTYRAIVDGRPTDAELQRLREGVDLDDGCTAPAEVEDVASAGGTTVLLLTIREGRKRQVRRMLSSVGHPVVGLRRVAFGPVLLGDQPPGTLRALTAEEVAELKAATGL